MRMHHARLQNPSASRLLVNDKTETGGEIARCGQVFAVHQGIGCRLEPPTWLRSCHFLSQQRDNNNEGIRQTTHQQPRTRRPRSIHNRISLPSPWLQSTVDMTTTSRAGWAIARCECILFWQVERLTPNPLCSFELFVLGEGEKKITEKVVSGTLCQQLPHY